MSITTYENPTLEKIKPDISDSDDSVSTARSLFTRETGQTLITLGMLFKHVPPFNESIDKSTGDTLISIGNKLKRKK